jgi:hypothetical protein
MLSLREAGPADDRPDAVEVPIYNTTYYTTPHRTTPHHTTPHHTTPHYSLFIPSLSIPLPLTPPSTPPSPPHPSRRPSQLKCTPPSHPTYSFTPSSHLLLSTGPLTAASIPTCITHRPTDYTILYLVYSHLHCPQADQRRRWSAAVIGHANCANDGGGSEEVRPDKIVSSSKLFYSIA